MPEIRLGAGENLGNINLGSVEVEEVRLGTILVWRNNVAPFLSVSVNGTVVDTNGTPLLPVDTRTPANAILTTFTYNDIINIEATGVVDEDMQYPVQIRLYAGNFEADDTLIPFAVGNVPTANGTASLQIPRGPQPSGPNADFFVYADQLYTLVAEDAEQGITYIFFRITRADVPDQWNSSPFVDTGARFNQRADNIVQAGLTTTTGTQCFDATRTTTTFTRTTPRQVASQNQVRTNTYQVNGIDDRGTNPLRSQPVVPEPTRTNVRTVEVNRGAPTDVVTGVVNTPNPAHVAGATAGNNVGGGTRNAAAIVTAGACVVRPIGFFCRCTAMNCNGTQTTTSQARTEQTNCAGNGIGVFNNVGAPTMGNRNCNGPNPGFQPVRAAVSRCRAGGGANDIASFGAEIQNRNAVTVRAEGTCANGNNFGVQRQVSCPGNPVDGTDCTGGPCRGVAAVTVCPGSMVVNITCNIV